MGRRSRQVRRNYQNTIATSELGHLESLVSIADVDRRVDFPFTFCWIPIASLNVDRQNYQRNLDLRWMNKLQREFNPLFMEVLIVNQRLEDGRYYVVNGQHRFEMLKNLHGELTQIPCMVSNVDHATERAMFLSQKEQKAIKRIDQAHAQPDGPGERCIVAAMEPYQSVPDFVGRYVEQDDRTVQPSGGLLTVFKRIPNEQDAHIIVTTAIGHLLKGYRRVKIQDNIFEGMCNFVERYRYAYHADILDRALASTSLEHLKLMRDDFGSLHKSYRERAAAAIVQAYNIEATRVNPLAMLPEWKQK